MPPRGGNFGLAAATAAAGPRNRQPRSSCPGPAPPAKVERLRRTAAESRVTGAVYDDSLAASREHARCDRGARGARVRRPGDRRRPGRRARASSSSTAPALDTVLAGVGGGGLSAGTAAWFGDRGAAWWPGSVRSQAYAAALAAAKPVEVGVSVTVRLARRPAGRRRSAGRCCASARRLGARLTTTRFATLSTGSRPRSVGAEPGGAAALAALTSRAYVPEPASGSPRSSSGGNFDPASGVTKRVPGD